MARKFKELVADWSPERVAAVEERTRELLREMPISELRQARNVTQEALAASLGTSQASVSKLERRNDMYLSSLRRMVRAMGGDLEITARFPDGDIRLGLQDRDAVPRR
ncbi:XRE family transcriptional regulator [Longimicrobium sp.]|uniref:XRE family transcriptional regulator n=1 Tax=Longimicrobium sp. TaxID=2029185 RepID=UPI002E341F97|nr:XRE family transcriptional regulator [Longimicrobium sp.]HEX6040413.1 XRE family transcriptional regulator [Longimicrobium sp.]